MNKSGPGSGPGVTSLGPGAPPGGQSYRTARRITGRPAHPLWYFWRLACRAMLSRQVIFTQLGYKQCCGSMKFWYGSGSSYIRQWPSRCQLITF
jgi:hypothetical protein